MSNLYELIQNIKSIARDRYIILNKYTMDKLNTSMVQFDVNDANVKFIRDLHESIINCELHELKSYLDIDSMKSLMDDRMDDFLYHYKKFTSFYNKL